MSNKYRKEMGKRSRAALAFANLKLNGVAEKLELSPGGFSNYLKGEREMPCSVAITFSRLCGVNLLWLITGRGPMVAETEEAYNRALDIIDSLEKMSTDDPDEKLTSDQHQESGLLLYALLAEVRRIFKDDPDATDKLDEIQQNMVRDSIPR